MINPSSSLHDGIQTSVAQPAAADKKQESLAGRKIIRLPASQMYQSKWEQIGVMWLEPMDKTTSLAKAYLPEGWSARVNPPQQPDLQHIILVDNNDCPKVDILIKTTFYDCFASASFL